MKWLKLAKYTFNAAHISHIHRVEPTKYHVYTHIETQTGFFFAGCGSVGTGAKYWVVTKTEDPEDTDFDLVTKFIQSAET